MRQPPEQPHPLRRLGHRHPAQVGDEQGGHDILDVVRAEDRQRRDRERADLPSLPAHDDLLALQAGALRQVDAAAERMNPGADRRLEAPDLRVVAVEDGVVGRALVEEEPAFRLVVSQRARIAILVIGAQVQECPDPGPERLDPLELEGRELDDVVMVG